MSEERHLLCEKCRTDLAIIDEDKIGMPITAAMFKPKRNHTATPWPSNFQWSEIICPMCGYRPFQLPNRVFTDKGYLDLEYQEPANYDCPCCDRVFETKRARGSHIYHKHREYFDRTHGEGRGKETA